MFDIGFGEVVLIAVVALLVVGPKELPGLIRGISSWMARARTVVGELKSEFDRELAHAEELKRLVEREVEVEAAELRKVADEANKTIPIEPSRTTPPSPSSPNPPAGSTDKSALPPRDRSDP